MLAEQIKLFHTEIKVKTIAKNGSERFGAKAECKFWFEGEKIKIGITQWAKTKQEAKEKLLKLLENDGKNILDCKNVN